MTWWREKVTLEGFKRRNNSASVSFPLLNTTTMRTIPIPYLQLQANCSLIAWESTQALMKMSVSSTARSPITSTQRSPSSPAILRTMAHEDARTVGPRWKSWSWDGSIAQWQSTCLACVRSWVSSQHHKERQKWLNDMDDPSSIDEKQKRDSTWC